MSRVQPGGPPPAAPEPRQAEALVDVLERIAIGAVALTTRALAEAEPGSELTFPQWRVMMILGDRPDGARVGEVAARVGVTLPATSRLIRRLAGRGLVTLSTDERDHRATRARLTEEGDRVRRAILADRRHRLEEIAARVSADAEADALRHLGEIADRFDSYA